MKSGSPFCLSCAGSYYCGVSVANVPNVGAPPPTIAAFAVIQYQGSNSTDSPATPEFPSLFDATQVDIYFANLKSLSPYDLPETLNHELVYVSGIGSVVCNANETCTTKLAGTIQNTTFDDPQVFLQCSCVIPVILGDF